MFSGFARYAAVGAVVGTGVGSTSLLTWFLKPYVISMQLNDGKPLESLKGLSREKLSQMPIEMETMDMFGRRREIKAKVCDFRAANTWRPMVTWENKKTGELFYVHPELLGETQEGQKFLKEMNRN